MPFDVLAHGEGIIHAGAEVQRRLAMKLHYAGQHAPEPWFKQVSSLGEERVEAHTVVLETGVRLVHAEAHV